MTPSSAATTSTTIVGNFGAAGTHARERFVARRIDEDDRAAVLLDRGCADVLRDAAGFALGHVGGADRVEQRRFAVIDVAHDGDHGRPLACAPPPSSSAGCAISCCSAVSCSKLTVDDGRAERARQILGQFHIERLVDGGEDLAVHQFLNDEVGLESELFGEFLDRDAFGNGERLAFGEAAGLFTAPRLGRRSSFPSRSASRSITGRGRSFWPRACLGCRARCATSGRSGVVGMQVRGRVPSVGPGGGAPGRERTNGCPGRMGPLYIG